MFFRARVAHFYGWTHHYIEEIDYVTLIEYYNAIDVIEARKTLVDLKVSDFPKLIPNARKKFQKSVEKRATYEETEEVTTESLARMLNGS